MGNVVENLYAIMSQNTGIVIGLVVFGVFLAFLIDSIQNKNVK